MNYRVLLSDHFGQRLYVLGKRPCFPVVPLRFGAGVKGKVLEAIRFGVPLVTTSVGAEGIPEAGQVMAIADDASHFAAAICAKLASGRSAALDERLWLEQYFSRDSALTQINELVSGVRKH